jgi:HSP20 family protein
MTNEISTAPPRADPWTDLDRAFDQMREHLGDVWGLRPFGPAFVPIERLDSGAFRAARTDVTDTGKSYKIVAEVPGIPKDKLDIRIRGTSVEIRGENATNGSSKDAEFVHRERTYAGYFRYLELPEPVVATEAKAKVENGLLELELPKEHPAPEPSEVKVAVQ